MEIKCNCKCLFPWLSGFFAAPAIMHLIRVVAKWDVVWNGRVVPMSASWVIFIVTAVLAVLFCVLGCKKDKEEAPGCC